MIYFDLPIFALPMLLPLMLDVEVAYLYICHAVAAICYDMPLCATEYHAEL